MKRIILMITILVGGYSFGQKSFSITTGEAYSDKMKGLERSYFYKDNQLYSLKKKDKKLELQKFNAKTGNFISSHEEERFEKNEYLLGTISMLNDDYLIGMKIDRVGNEGKIYATPIDYEKGKLGEEIILKEEKEKIVDYFKSNYQKEVRTSFAKGFNQEVFFTNAKIIASLDQSKLAVHYVKSVGNRRDNKENTTFTWIQYDDKMNKLWEKDVEYPYPSKQIIELDYHLANNGDIYFLVRVNGEKRAAFAEEDYDVEIFKIDGKNQLVSHRSVEAPYDLINYMVLTENKDNQVYLMGSYDNSVEKNKRKERKAKKTFEGYFAAKIQEDLSLTDFQKYALPTSTKTQYVKKSHIKSLTKKGELNNLKLDGYYIRDIDFNDDGSFVLYSEKSFIIVKVDRETNQETYYYIGSFIIGIGVDEAGKMVWSKKIPKHQQSTLEYGGSGYFYTSNDDYSYLVYGDSKKNLFLDTEKLPDRYWNGVPKSNGVLVVRRIDKKTGSMVTESAMPLKNVDGRWLNRRFGIFRFYEMGEGNFGFEGATSSGKETMFLFQAK